MVRPLSKSVLGGCRVKEPSRRRPSEGSFFVHSFEVDARDPDIGRAEPGRTTRIHGAGQEIEPEIDPGVCGVRARNKQYSGLLYTVALRFRPARSQQVGRTDSAPESFRYSIE